MTMFTKRMDLNPRRTQIIPEPLSAQCVDTHRVLFISNFGLSGLIYRRSAPRTMELVSGRLESVRIKEKGTNKIK
jgi:hypothetical protein